LLGLGERERGNSHSQSEKHIFVDQEKKDSFSFETQTTKTHLPSSSSLTHKNNRKNQLTSPFLFCEYFSLCCRHRVSARLLCRSADVALLRQKADVIVVPRFFRFFLRLFCASLQFSACAFVCLAFCEEMGEGNQEYDYLYKGSRFAVFVLFGFSIPFLFPVVLIGDSGVGI
jgi:hypothetical protein